MVKPVQLSLGEDEIKALAGYHEDDELHIGNIKCIVNCLNCNLIYAIITNVIILMETILINNIQIYDPN